MRDLAAELSAAAHVARILVNRISIIRGLWAAGYTTQATAEYQELNRTYADRRHAIDKVVRELAAVRNASFSCGDFTATTAHEMAMKMLYALNREAFVEDIEGEQVEVWPSGEAVQAEIDWEYRKAVNSLRADDQYLPAEPPTKCAKRLKVCLDTLKKYIDDGHMRCKKVTARKWQLHRGDVRKLGGEVDD